MKDYVESSVMSSHQLPAYNKASCRDSVQRCQSLFCAIHSAEFILESLKRVHEENVLFYKPKAPSYTIY